MAEVAATVIAIVTFGAQITSKLYDVGAYINGIRADTDRVANNVSLYSNVLELLADRFNSDSPIHSSKALRLANRICTRSELIFEDIYRRLPKTNADCASSFSWVEKTKWYFRRKHVNSLVNELECLKSTASLLLNVLAVGKSIRRRRRRRSNQHNEPDPELEKNLIQTQNSVVSYFDALEKLSTQENNENQDNEEDLEADVKLITEGLKSDRLETSPSQQSQTALIVREDSQAIMSISSSLDLENTAMGKRQLVIHRIDSMLDSLLHEWTRLDLDEDEYAEIVETCMTHLSERRHHAYPQNATEATHRATTFRKTDQQDAVPSTDWGPPGTARSKQYTSIIDDEMLAMVVRILGDPDNPIHEIFDRSETNSQDRFLIRGYPTDPLVQRLQESIRTTSQALRDHYHRTYRYADENGVNVDYFVCSPETARSDTRGHSKVPVTDDEHYKSSDDIKTPPRHRNAGIKKTELRHRAQSDDVHRHSRKDKTEDNTSAQIPENHVYVEYVPITSKEQRDGISKQLERSRRRWDAETGKVVEETITLELPVRPGMKLGSKFKYARIDLLGDEETGFHKVDWHFIIDTPLHTIQAIRDDFHQKWKPQVYSFIEHPPANRRQRERDHRRLSQILDRETLRVGEVRDMIDVTGETSTLVSEVFSELDEATPDLDLYTM